MLDTDLDLRFSPVDNASPRRLSPAQIDAYNASGFVQPFTVFSEDEITGVRDYVNALMENMGPEGAYGINCYQARLSGLWDIATDARILDLVDGAEHPDRVMQVGLQLVPLTIDPEEP